jgi:hypothetical protein
MPVYQIQVRMWDHDSDLPRDAAINTLYFDDRGVTTDPDGLCDAVLGVYADKCRQVHMEATAYDVHEAKPRSPKGHAVRNLGVSGSVGSLPREIAICLSFYAGSNRPRNRGRIYLPCYLLSGVTIDQRPSATVQQVALAFATVSNSSFPDVGGVDVQWVVWSPTDDAAKPITNGWVDDEWDTVRSRGLRPTTRQTFARQG